MSRMPSSLAIAATLFLASMIPASAATKVDSFAPVFVKLSAVGGSGQSGSAIMRQLGPRIVISGTVANELPTVLEPSYVHKGSCGTNGPIMHDLGSLTRGTLGTTVLSGFTIAQLHAMHASIVIHKSDKALRVVVSCGNI
ncbi:MAG: hypothetical protein JWN27_4450 [Candidatus Eremiobacteraeota bacterium]|nr:hypothetical protein [Candidatus Eremiobacteraeota bacterium]